ncbi:MAG: hypothetical protein ACRDQA_31115 [Nocardioidaceae bacterium]
MSEEIDWSKRGDYIRSRHGVEPRWATDAVNDPVAYWLDSDPASTSGRSVRVIGHSAGADAVLTVICCPPTSTPPRHPAATGGAPMPGWPTTATGASTERGNRNHGFHR